MAKVLWAKTTLYSIDLVVSTAMARVRRGWRREKEGSGGGLWGSDGEAKSGYMAGDGGWLAMQGLTTG